MSHDSLIDAAARGMTDLAPTPDFRARVLRQLNAPPRRRWMPALVSVTVVAAGAIVLAVVWRSVGPDTTTETVPLPPPLAVSADSAPPTSGPSAEAAEHGQTPGTPNGTPISADELAWHSRTLPPLPVLPPMVIEPIQPSAPSIALIVVTPLVTEPLILPPIESGPGGRRPLFP